MGIFDFSSTSLVFKAVEQISERIKSATSFKYFAAGDTKMIREYKEFETTLIASAIATLALNLDLNDPKQKKDVQTVYIGKCSGFIGKVISGKYKLLDLEVDGGFAKLFYRGNIEAMLCSKIHVKFETYLSDIKKALNANTPFYFLEYSEQQIAEADNEEENGEERLFDFINNLLLAKEGYDWDDENIMGDKVVVDYKIYFELSSEEIDLFNSFMEDIELIVKG